MKKYLIKSVILLGLVVILFIFAIKFDLFFIFSHFDVMMHILGGVVLGYLGLFLFPLKKLSKRLFATGLFTFGIAILWEVFERVGFRIVPKIIQYGDWIDTSQDIIYAILAALLIVIIETHHD